MAIPRRASRRLASACVALFGVLSLVFASLAFPPRARAAELSSVSCSGFLPAYSGPEDKACAAGDVTGSGYHNGNATANRLEVTGASFFLSLTYYQGHFDIYFPYRDLRAEVDSNPNLTDVRDWQPLASTHGFEVAFFHATMKRDGATAFCAVIQRHGAGIPGPYEFPDGPGYKAVMVGYFCPSGARAPDAALDEVLGKLQMPPGF